MSKRIQINDGSSFWHDFVIEDRYYDLNKDGNKISSWSKENAEKFIKLGYWKIRVSYIQNLIDRLKNERN